MGNLPGDVDEAILRQSFSSFGELENATIVRDPQTGRSRGFGYVTFRSAEDANAAIDLMHGSEMGGRQIKVNLSAPRTPRPGRDRSW